jgi:regulator of sigma E protease
MATPAYKAGLSAGDRILAIDGTPVKNWSDMTDLISASPGQELQLTIERDGRTQNVAITPMAENLDGETVGRIGIAPASQESYLVRFGFADGIVHGTRGALDMVARTMGGIVTVFSSPSNLSQLSGPVAIIQASGDAAKAGWDRLLNFGVLISVALMVFNLLPIPILDGGMVLLSVLEAVRGRPIGDKGLMIYQGIGMAVLGTLLVFVLINDPLRILQRRSALGRIDDVVP